MNCNNRIVVTTTRFRDENRELLLYLDEHNHPIEIHTQRSDAPSYVGNIYIARVSQVMEQMNAAFLQAGDLKFFYPLEPFDSIIFTRKTGNPTYLCQGDELVVQVVRDAIKSKEICVSTNISFCKPHVILTTGKKKHGVSKKITGKKREELKSYVDSFHDCNYGIVIRTKAEAVELSDLHKEIDELVADYERFLEQVIHKTAGQLIQKAQHPFMEHISRLQHEAIDEVVVASEAWYKAISEQFGDTLVIHKYDDASYPLEKLYGIEKMLEDAMQKKVYMPSGGYLLIEPTETLTVIDVNSGKNTQKKSSKDYYYMNNKEAAREIARQLRLRNISGMILVDFINMTDEADWAELLRYMRKLVKDDYLKVNVFDVTKLGLMEITRTKKYKPLNQM